MDNLFNSFPPTRCTLLFENHDGSVYELNCMAKNVEMKTQQATRNMFGHILFPETDTEIHLAVIGDVSIKKVNERGARLTESEWNDIMEKLKENL